MTPKPFLYLDKNSFKDRAKTASMTARFGARAAPMIYRSARFPIHPPNPLFRGFRGARQGLPGGPQRAPPSWPPAGPTVGLFWAFLSPSLALSRTPLPVPTPGFTPGPIPGSFLLPGQVRRWIAPTCPPKVDCCVGFPRQEILPLEIFSRKLLILARCFTVQRRCPPFGF